MNNSVVFLLSTGVYTSIPVNKRRFQPVLKPHPLAPRTHSLPRMDTIIVPCVTFGAPLVIVLVYLAWTIRFERAQIRALALRVRTHPVQFFHAAVALDPNGNVPMSLMRNVRHGAQPYGPDLETACALFDCANAWIAAVLASPHPNRSIVELLHQMRNVAFFTERHHLQPMLCAFVMGTHRRLGAGSWVHALPEHSEVFAIIQRHLLHAVWAKKFHKYMHLRAEIEDAPPPLRHLGVAPVEQIV